MSARTSAARVLAAQKELSLAKTFGEQAAVREDTCLDGQALKGLRIRHASNAVLCAAAEGAYFAKLQDLRGEASA